MTAQSAAIYRMQENIYLGDSMVAVYNASDQEMADNGLTSGPICTYIKTPLLGTIEPTAASLANNPLFTPEQAIWLRIASSCEFGTFGDSHCDCELQRKVTLQAIGDHGQGIYVNLPQEGLGNGLFYKAQELELQVNGYMPDGEYVGEKNFWRPRPCFTTVAQ